jgi:hypothetical protein
VNFEKTGSSGTANATEISRSTFHIETAADGEDASTIIHLYPNQHILTCKNPGIQSTHFYTQSFTRKPW